MNTTYDITIEKHRKAKRKSRLQSEYNRSTFFRGLNPHNQDFKCTHCRNLVSAERLIAAVGNRNHCPYCLWSRHMDLHKAGDRLSACKQPMKAVTLTLKRTPKKYSCGKGELMVVHLCLDCGKVSANRIAADDDPDNLWQVFELSQNLDAHTRLMIESAGIQPLENGERPIVRAQLFGKDYGIRAMAS